MGVSGSALSLFASYLTGRSYQIYTEDSTQTHRRAERQTDRETVYVDVMDHLLMLLLLLWSSGLQAEGNHTSTELVKLVGGDSRCAGTLEMKHEVSSSSILDLTCSEPVRLVGGASRCAGTLEVKQGDWRSVDGSDWNLKKATVVCRELDCGSAVSVGWREESSERSMWKINFDCVQSGSALRECLTSDDFFYTLDLTCSDSVRLVNGTSLCSGRLEVKPNQSNQWWFSVCEDGFDQQDAEVVCRELGCGAPSVLQGALYGEVEAPMWTKEFQCGGNESALLDCRSSGSDRNTCSPDKAVGLTCSEPVRLVGGDSRCAGTLEVKLVTGDWRPVYVSETTLKEAAVLCRQLDCGSAVSIGQREELPDRSVWWMDFHCVLSGSALRECLTSHFSSSILDLTCSDLLLKPIISVSSSMYGVSEAQQQEAQVLRGSNFTICCSIQPQYPGGSFQLTFTSSNSAHTYTQPAVNHSADFLFPAAEPAHQGSYSCVYHLYVFNHTFSSESRLLSITVLELVRLVGGDSRCAGTLEMKHEGDWRPVDGFEWTLKEAAAFCRELDCGFAVSMGWREKSSRRSVWFINTTCVQSGSALKDCVMSVSSSSILDLTCSDSVRLVNGTSLCSGRLEVKSNQSNQSNQWWSSVCEDDFDQQDAEVVCRELGCGAPSVLQGALYGEVEAPMWTKEFQCGGNESALLDCRSSGSDRNTCSPGKAVGLTCSEPVRLVGGASRCDGTLEMKRGDWRPVFGYDWNLKKAAVFCRELDCGSAVSVGRREESSFRSVWKINFDCVQSGFALRECLTSDSFSYTLDLTCSDSVRLVNGTSLCSGRLEVKSNQSNQSNQWWSSVCEDDFDQQDAEVVCRELGCGAPSVLQGALYGEVEAPMWTKEFQCGGHESALLDCRSSGSDRNTCSPGKAVGLTCSEPVRLVGGDSRCAGTLEVKLGDWRPVDGSYRSLKEADIVCRQLDCGSAVSIGQREELPDRSVWWIDSHCVLSGSALRECLTSHFSSSILDLTCSNLLLQPIISVSSSMYGVSEAQQQEAQVLRGSNFTICCSIQPQYPGGSFQLTFTSSNSAHNYTQPAVNHSADFLIPAAEPAHQGSYSCVYHLYVFNHNFSSESRLLSITVSGLQGEGNHTSTEPVRLVGGDSRCAGTLEIKHQGDWRPVFGSERTLKETDVFCRDLDCGSAVSVGRRVESSNRSMWEINYGCVQSGSALKDCVTSGSSYSIVDLTCSDLLLQPIISVSSSMYGVSEAQQQEAPVLRGSNFTICCSIQPQYPNGSFQLTFTSSNSAHNYTQPAVNHSAHFLFPAAEPAHQGSYSCVYHLYVFNHNFSSESRLLSITVSDPLPLIIKAVVLPLTLLVVIASLYFYCKASRG
ncbi:scavenger receptor cysteine-rich type 1 protein M130-like [Cebidichthys violaceus]|uniref:scavenger receptor cysteine-rich type 1 protein M130-like n=1 Tax=Cebidichthys violaceus TaxID=271503 RepID=UPI0035CBD16D